MKKNVTKRLAFLGLMILTLAGCASGRPILDENDKVMKVGEARAERDIDDCLVRADRYLARHKADIENKAVTRGAVKGATVGAVIGLVSGRNLGATVGGAALGAGVGAGGALLESKARDPGSVDPLKSRYVENCLKRRDYEVIGWK